MNGTETKEGVTRGSQDRAVSTVTAPRVSHLRNRGSIPGMCNRFVSTSQRPNCIWCPPGLLLIWYRGILPRW